MSIGVRVSTGDCAAPEVSLKKGASRAAAFGPRLLDARAGQGRARAEEAARGSPDGDGSEGREGRGNAPTGGQESHVCTSAGHELSGRGAP